MDMVVVKYSITTEEKTQERERTFFLGTPPYEKDIKKLAESIKSLSRGCLITILTNQKAGTKKEISEIADKLLGKI